MKLSNQIQEKSIRGRFRLPWLLLIGFSITVLIVAWLLYSAGSGSALSNSLMFGETAKTVAESEATPEIPVGASYQPVGPQALFVLDLNRNDRDWEQAVSYVRVFDSRTHQEVLTIPARSYPNLALSRDGHYLYVLDAYKRGVIRGESVNTLAIHDLQQGVLVTEITLPPQRTPYIGIPVTLELVPAPGGSELYVILSNVTDGTHVLTVNTGTFEVVENLALHSFCGSFWLAVETGRLLTLCTGQSATQQLTAVDLHEGQVDRTPPIQITSDTDLENVPSITFSASDVALESNHLFGLSPDDRLITLAPEQSVPLAQIALAVPANVESVGHRAFAISPDGSHVYVGFRSTAESSLTDETIFGKDSYADQIGVFDTTTGTQIGWIQLEEPALTLALSLDGQSLYAVSPQTQSITVIDVAALQPVASIQNAGQTPVLVIPGP